HTHLPPPHLHPFPTRRSSDLIFTSTSPSTRLRFRSSRRSSPLPSLPSASLERSGEKLQPKLWPSSGIRHPRSRRSELGSTRTSRSEEHTSELQSRGHLVCRLL